MKIDTSVGKKSEDEDNIIHFINAAYHYSPEDEVTQELIHNIQHSGEVVSSSKDKNLSIFDQAFRANVKETTNRWNISHFSTAREAKGKSKLTEDAVAIGKSVIMESYRLYFENTNN
jgi:hypothetical protein